MRISVSLILAVLIVGSLAVFAYSDMRSSTEEERSSDLDSLAVYSRFSAEEKIGPDLLEKFDQGAQELEVIINVRMPNGDVPSDVRAINDIKSKISEEKVLDSLGSDSFLARLNEQELRSLARNRNVFYVEDNKELRLTLNDAVTVIEADKAWTKKDMNNMDLIADGRSICVIDTGIDFTHPDLAGKNPAPLGGCNLYCVAPGPCVLDCSQLDTDGHGTHVAGIAAASGGVMGVGNGADLIGVKIFEDGSEVTDTFKMKKAMDWCVSNKETYDISAVTLSVATDELYSDHCDAENVAVAASVDNAVLNGLSVVASTGNDANYGGIGAPACVTNAIAVSATDDSDNFFIDSNYANNMVRLLAPGDNILSTCSYLDDDEGSGLYCHKSGTSMSAPMVAAAIAIIDQFLDSDGQTTTPADFEDLLFNTGDGILGLPSGNAKRINVNNALLSLDTVSPNVNLASPNDETVLNNRGRGQTFTCEVSDWSLDSVTMEIIGNRLGGAVVYSSTQSLSGESAQADFFVDTTQLETGSYSWNCLTSDTNGNEGLAKGDYEFIIDSDVSATDESLSDTTENAQDEILQ